MDHNTRTTHWRRPTSETMANQSAFEAGRAEARAQHEARERSRLTSGSSTAPSESTAATTAAASTLTPATSSDSGLPAAAAAAGATGAVADVGDPLPAGWEERSTPDGRKYYVYHPARLTQWEDPRLAEGRPTLDYVHLLLPSGWEVRSTPEGRQYFVDHNQQATTFRDPRIDMMKQQNNIPQYQRDFKYKAHYFRSGAYCQVRPGQSKINVDRDNLFQMSVSEIMKHRVNPQTQLAEGLLARLYITFRGEQGLDYGGVARWVGGGQHSPRSLGP